MFYFSKSTNGFYHPDVNGTMPADVVPITKERHAALMRGQSNGQLIAAGADGHPVLQDPPKVSDDVAAIGAQDARPPADGIRLDGHLVC